MSLGAQIHPITNRTAAPFSLQADSSESVPHVPISMSEGVRPLSVVAHCAGRAPGHRCYSIDLPGFSTCPAGHSLVPYSAPWIGIQPAV